MEYGIQLYSVRDAFAADMEGTLKMLREIGYESVEFAGFQGRSALEIKEMLSRTGLRVSGTHTPLCEVVESFDETVAYHRIIGNTNIIIPMEDLDSMDKINAFIETVNEYQPRLEAIGIRMGYHNHLHEFFPNRDGSMIYEEIVRRTRLLLELDVGWAYSAGEDVLSMLDRLGERVSAVHIRDSFPSKLKRGEPLGPINAVYESVFAWGIGKPLGLAAAPVREVYRVARRRGITLIVESESQNPDGLTEAQLCMDFLRQMEGEQE